MTEFEIGPETQRPHPPGGWSYAVTCFADGRVTTHTVTLSFQDYDLWSRGRVGPSRVVDAALRFLLEHQPAGDMPERWDCSTLRRSFGEVDAVLPGMF